MNINAKIKKIKKINKKNFKKHIIIKNTKLKHKFKKN